MLPSLIRWTSRTTYRGAKGSGAGNSPRTSATSSPASRNTFIEAYQAGRLFKRSQRGLFDGKERQVGNNVPHSRRKTHRTWTPNVQHNTLWSDTLNRSIRTKTTTGALRSIDKMGGLDYYLANTDAKKLGAWGRNLRDELAIALREKRLKGKQTSQTQTPTPSEQRSRPLPRA